MAKKKNDLLLLGLLGVGGAYLLYKHSAAGSLVQAPLSAMPAAPQTLMSAPPMDASTAATGISNPGDTVILNWFQTLSPANAKQALAQWPNMTQIEKAGLYDLIVNDWEGGQGNTAARIQFWDSWRVKYHVNDGTYP